MKKWLEYQFEHMVNQVQKSSQVGFRDNFYAELNQYFDPIKKFYDLCKTKRPDFYVDQLRIVGSTGYAKAIKETYDDPVVQENIEQWCADPEYRLLLDAPSIDRLPLDSAFKDFCKEICDLLGADHEQSSILLQVQRPGYITPLHIDAQRLLPKDASKKFGINEPPSHLRWIMFLDDWKRGQVCQMDEEFIKWQAGDVISWDVTNTPHAFANLGYDNRFLVIIKAAVKNN